MSSHTDIYQHITAQLISTIEQNTATGRFRLPWHHDGLPTTAPVNALSAQPYRGINILALWAAAVQAGYDTGEWATYRQWQTLGAQVNKGEKGSLVVFWKTLDPEDEGPAQAMHHTASAQRRLLARTYHVFNAQQVKGYTPPARPVLSESHRVERAERFFAQLGGEVHRGGFEAYYDPRQDCIHIPDFKCFVDHVSYYSTLAHEYTHFTGHPSRLGRDLSGRFGSHAYAAEELVAELGAAFCCSRLNLAVEPRPDHAKYLKSWLDILRGDKRALFAAASQAQHAVAWMEAQQHG